MPDDTYDVPTLGHYSGGFNRPFRPNPRGTLGGVQVGRDRPIARNNQLRGRNMVRTYKLYSSAVATASNVASLTFPQSGVIQGISFAVAGIAGAGYCQAMLALSLSSVSTLFQNDTPGNDLLTVAACSSVNSQAFQANGVSGVGVAVRAGDKLYVHYSVVGTAPGALQAQFHIYVNA